jgi:nitroreductase
MEKDTIRAALKEAIYQRRSTRAYTAALVPDELIEEVLDAGRYAPSGMNAQNTRFFVMTNADKLAELKAILTGIYANMQEEGWMPPFLLQLIKAAKAGETVDNTYGAPVLIVTANKKESHNSIADCSCALSNMMLAASAAGLGNCWINQVFTFRDAPPIREFFIGLGLADDEELCGALALGYTEKLEAKPLPRTGNPVTYIR